MEPFHGNAIKVEAEMPLQIGRVQVVRKVWSEPIDVHGASRAHHLELSLLPRSKNAVGCFPDYWGPNRFERIGEMFLLPAHHAVHAKSNCRHQNSIVCSFDPAATTVWFDRDLEWTDRRLQGSLDIVNAEIRNLLFRIGEEIRSPGFASETMVELMAGQAVIELSRHLFGIGERQAMGGLAPWRLKLIDERLTDGSEPPALSELADLCSLSIRQLTRAFRVSRGRSVGAYLAEHRIDRAKQLLAAGMGVKSAAYAAGFTAPSNFAAAFQRATGETPREYRERASRRFVVATTVSPKTH